MINFLVNVAAIIVGRLISHILILAASNTRLVRTWMKKLHWKRPGNWIEEEEAV